MKRGFVSFWRDAVTVTEILTYNQLDKLKLYSVRECQEKIISKFGHSDNVTLLPNGSFICNQNLNFISEKHLNNYL